MVSRARQWRAVAAVAGCGYLLVCFLDGVWPVSHIVSYLVGMMVLRPEPAASFKSNDLQTRARQWKYGESSGRT